MASYLIAHVQVQNSESFREYERGVLRTIKPFGGWVLAAGPGEALEGAEPANHNVVIRFPTLAAARLVAIRGLSGHRALAPRPRRH